MEWLKGAQLVRLILNIHIVTPRRRTTQMDPWEMFSEMCRRVAVDQNVVLEVSIINGLIEMSLAPAILEEDSEGDE
jgi:hypothetical protein